MRIGTLMLTSTIAISGLYAGIAIMPILVGTVFSQRQYLPPPVVPVQSLPADLSATETLAQGPSEFEAFPAQAQFETGDTWISGGRRYRLYGLQACLRGTDIAVSTATFRDCGELNVIMTQALITDTRPVCTILQQIDDNNAVVACQTTAGEHRYDLATYMIAKGWGFAAVDGTGQLIVPGYRVAEESARSARAGLWAYSDMPHPVAALMQQAGGSR
jgi:endonuclease YncB( thermonuclease family)